jgi:hypothetical protein
MLIYFTLGLLWCWWLEYYTTSNLEGELGKPWVWRERIFHWVLWPWSLGTFIYAIIREYKKRK